MLNLRNISYHIKIIVNTLNKHCETMYNVPKKRRYFILCYVCQSLSNDSGKGSLHLKKNNYRKFHISILDHVLRP